MIRRLLLAFVVSAAPSTAPAGEVEDAIRRVLGGDPAEYRRVIEGFQAALRAGDAVAAAGFVAYPIDASVAGRRVHVADAAGFVARYPEIVTDALAQAVAAQPFEDLFVRDQGVMLGNGEIWVAAICRDAACAVSDVRVVAIQSGRLSAALQSRRRVVPVPRSSDGRGEAMDGATALREKYLTAIAAAADESALEALRLAALGKKGEVALALRGLGAMPPEARMSAGPALNALRDEIASALAAAKAALGDAALEARLAAEWLDVTLPARPAPQGSIHPVSQATDEIAAIFADLGFAVAEGPQVEDDWHNFDALNIAPEHPARQTMDTFYMARAAGDNRPPHVLRTHTSPVQIRHLQAHGAPCRVIAPGRVYRADYDQTHTPMFHQVEGLAIDRDVTMANLKWVLEEFCRAFFEVDGVELKFRASHFPFTEPSAEVDIRCSWAGGQLKIGEGDDWLEILGSGMVHPRVLAAAGVDPERWQGFAFGMGIDRLAMLKYGIPDLRAFFDSDLRWLRHYGFAALDIPTLQGGLSR